MRLVTASEMRAIDKHAIEKIGIPSLVLMENAGLKVLFTLEKIFGSLKDKHFTIVCGRGNNAGDGLVVARHLANAGISIDVFLTARLDELSHDAAVNAAILMSSGVQPTVMTDVEDLDRLRVALRFSDIVIDAIFGTGFSGQFDSYLREVARIVNESSSQCVAIDLPSGIDADNGRASEGAVHADITITLAAPKLGMFLYPAREYIGEVWVADIGIPQASFAGVSSSCNLITENLASALLPIRRDASYKSTFGHLLVLGGSETYQGAGVLAASGGLRSGAGLVTLGLPSGIARNLSCPLPPEIIVHPFSERDGGIELEEEEIRSFVGRYSALVVGPGLGRSVVTKASIKKILSVWPSGLLLDADAIPAAADLSILQSHGAEMVITPHVGEMARLTGRTIASIQDDMIGAARELAESIKCVVVLKSYVTVVAEPFGRIYLCSRPNSGLARGGAGDILAGLIGGLMACGISALHAAVIGVFVHSQAAEIVKNELGADAMTITDILTAIPQVFKKLRTTDMTTG